MSKKSKTLIENEYIYTMYLARLQNLALNAFTWYNLPEGMDARTLELALNNKGKAILAYDKDAEQFVSLYVTDEGELNKYNVPQLRAAYGIGYFMPCDTSNSVIIYNNYMRTPTIPLVEFYARKLAIVEQTISVNLYQQKTARLIKTTENQRLSVINALNQVDIFQPEVVADKSFDENSIKILNSSVPYLVDNLYNYSRNLWGDALTALGYENSGPTKRERVQTSEITVAQGQVLAERETRLKSRQEGAEAFNKLFGTNVTVEFSTSPILLSQEIDNKIETEEGMANE